jgi:hypothetical protein
VKRYIADRLAHGQLPLWDPWAVAGVSLLGQLSPGLLHPWTLLYVVFPFDLAFKLNHLLPLLLAGVGAYLLARRLGATEAAAALSGVVYGGCGYLVSQASGNLIFVVGPAGVPIAIERFVAFLDEPRPGRLLAAAALLALCAYGGEPQSMLMGGLIGATFGVARAVARRKQVWRAVGATAAWGVLALGLAAPVALPALSTLQQSPRAHGLSRTELEKFATSPLRLPGIFVPRAFDDRPDLARVRPFQEYFDVGDDSGPFAGCIYLGGGALLLAAFSLCAGRRARFFLYGAIVLLVAATGEGLGLQPVLHRFVPGFRLFRYSEKLLAPASLCFAIAAGFGADAVFSTRRRRRWFAIAAGAVAAALFGFSALLEARPERVLAYLVEHGAWHVPAAAETFLANLIFGTRLEAELLALFCAIAVASLLSSRLPARALWAVAAGASLLIGTSGLLATTAVDLFHEPPILARELLKRAGPSEARWRVYVAPHGTFVRGDLDYQFEGSMSLREALRPQYNALFAIENVDDYFSNDDEAFHQFVSGAPREAFSMLAVRYLVELPSSMSEALAASRGFERTHFGLWLLTFPPWPRPRLLDRVESAPDVVSLAARLRQVDATRTAILLPRDLSLASEVREGVKGKARYSRPSPEHISVEAETSAPAILSVAEHFDRGWRATIDGVQVPTVPVDGVVLGVVVPTGTHAVDLRFRPTGLLAGFAIAAVMLIAFAIVCGVTRRVRSLT